MAIHIEVLGEMLQEPGGISHQRSHVPIHAVMAMATSYNWLFQWDYTFYKWGFLSTYN